ncbi:hypothetical protein [Zobellia russellii]|uniref:hypothetical protein n=1 Tax=Zobellia russellii TaxID=248907 RepID=UPI001BFEF8EB|nr:hypothetical protein [Zobellia russellii]MBT9190240.1 hypothetical protein [Zobellia russellii]
MAKAITVCFKNPVKKDISTLAKKIAKRIEPNNIHAKQPYISKNENTISLIYNPALTILKDGVNYCLGTCEHDDSLFKYNAPLPNGSYALFRVENERVEIASDYAASRTLWYYHDNEIFMASTSQRLIVSFLGDFKLNNKACSWFLCTGTLGPGLSWDERIKIVPPRTRLKLNRNNWKVEIDHNQNFNFDRTENEEKTELSHEAQLKNAVEETIKGLKLDTSKWTLALSGGMDSRSLLYHLKGKNLNAVTWGLDKALDLPTSDASIAKNLAQNCNMEHSYAKMDFNPNSFPILLERFLAAGEGRLDHLAAYLDGLELWGQLSASGRGVIRGYDAFGRKPPVTNSYQVRRTCNLMTSFDYTSSDIPEDFIVNYEDIPEHLHQKENESLGDWRDRLWLQHRTPITTAALEDIKLAYVEVINPLLSQKIVSSIQQVPIELRTNKKIWRSIVSEMFPEIPFAKREAVQEVGQILNLPEVQSYICESLEQKKELGIFPEAFIEKLVKNYNKDQRTQSARRKMRRLIIAYLPKSIENKIRSKLKAGPLSNQWLALRTLMILKTNEMFTSDAQVKQL